MLAPTEKAVKQPWYYTRLGWLELAVFVVVFAAACLLFSCAVHAAHKKPKPKQHDDHWFLLCSVDQPDLCIVLTDYKQQERR